MNRVDVLIIGAGPAGLSAALETSGHGLDTVVADAGLAPGGQLVKQIHKFFGSSRHRAGTRGIDIARELSAEVRDRGGRIWSDSPVYALLGNREAALARGLTATGNRACPMELAARAVIIATGAAENQVAVPGWTLPGVIGAGAAQTMLHVHRVRPGRKVLMVGAGNVGLIVTYQLLQADVEVAAVIDVMPRIGGYHVHAAKIARLGVPILTAHTLCVARGTDEVTGAVVAPVDAAGRPVREREFVVDVDTICIATGMRPDARLAWMAGCRGTFASELGGFVPLHGPDMETSIPGVFVAGDLAGVEEASIAMDEGRLAGISAALSLGAVDRKRGLELQDELGASLSALRTGSSVSPKAGRDRPFNSAAPGPRTGEADPAENDRLICRCEEITLSEVLAAIRQGARTVTGVKRRTRAGMGLCQGRSCEQLIAGIIARELETPRSEILPATGRPPAVPIPFGVLAREGRK